MLAQKPSLRPCGETKRAWLEAGTASASPLSKTWVHSLVVMVLMRRLSVGGRSRPQNARVEVFGSRSRARRCARVGAGGRAVPLSSAESCHFGYASGDRWLG